MLRHRYPLFEVLLVAGISFQPGCSETVIGKPDDATAVNEDTQDADTRRTSQQGWLLTVGVEVDAAALASGEYVVAVGIEGGDLLVLKQSLALNTQVAEVDAVQSLVGAHPDVVMIAFGNTVDCHACGGDELHVKLPGLVHPHLVHAYTVDGSQHVTATHHKQGEGGPVFLAAADVLEGIHNLVRLTVQHKHAPVIHSHPDVLREVGRQAVDAVVQIGYVTCVARAVVVEVVAVKSGKTVPGRYPQIAVVVLYDMCDGVAGQSVVCRKVRQRGL